LTVHRSLPVYPDTGSDGAYRPPGFLFGIDQLGDMAHRARLRHLALLFEKNGGLLDAFPVDAALAFVGCGFCRDGAGDAGINRLDAPKVALFPASRSAEPYGLAANNAVSDKIGILAPP